MSNVTLERTPEQQAYVEKRFHQGFEQFDKTHPLIQVIMKGWKEHSPSDSMVISPKLELMGRLPTNELSRLQPNEHYRMFLKRSLAGKRPGLREDTSVPLSIDWDSVLKADDPKTNVLKLVLTNDNPEQKVLSTFRTPEPGYQDYTVVEIDATAFENGGWLTISLQVGDAGAMGSFDLYDGNSKLPTKGAPQGALISAWDVPSEDRRVIEYYFPQGQSFKLGVTGSWFNEQRNINGFLAEISVEPGQMQDWKEEAPTHSYKSAEDLMNAFVTALKNLDSDALHPMVIGRAMEELASQDIPEESREQLSLAFSEVEVLNHQHVGDEFHFRLKLPQMLSPPEASVKMRKVEGIWFIYDIVPPDED